MMQQGRGGKAIVDIVQARQGNIQAAKFLALKHHRYAVQAVTFGDIHAAPGAAFGQAESLDLALGHPHGLDGLSIVAVGDHGARCGHQGREGLEGLDDRVEVGEAVEMVFLDVQDGRVPRAKVQETAVELARLSHKVPAGAYPAGAAELFHRRADDEAGVHARRVKHVSHHRRRRALTVRAGNGDADPLCHESA